MPPSSLIENHVQLEVHFSCGHCRDFYLEISPLIGDSLYCPQCRMTVTVMDRFRIRWGVTCQDCDCAIVKQPMLTRPTVVTMGEAHAARFGHVITLSRLVDTLRL